MFFAKSPIRTFFKFAFVQAKRELPLFVFNPEGNSLKLTERIGCFLALKENGKNCCWSKIGDASLW